MEIKRTTEIIVETNRRFIVRQPESAEQQYFCPNCGDAMLTAEQAAVVFAVSRRAVYQIVETQTAHFAETETGILLVCPNSLAETLANRTKTLGEKL